MKPDNKPKFPTFMPILIPAIIFLAVFAYPPVKAGIPDPPNPDVVLSSICGPQDVWIRPATPTALSAQPDLGDPSGKIFLQWSDNSNNEAGFVIERSDNPDDDFEYLAAVPAHAGGGMVCFTDQVDVRPSTAYYYRIYSTGGGDTESDYSEVAGAATADAPFFSETWDHVTGPYSPDTSYFADSSGTIDGADQSDWQWSTAGSDTNSVCFRNTGNGYEFGRFDTSDSGAFSASAPMEPIDFSQNQGIYAQFDVTVDPAGAGMGYRQTLELRSESDYNSGGSAIALWIDGSSDAPAFGAQAFNAGVSSNPVFASLGQISGSASKHYRVQTELIPNGTSLNLQYQVIDQDNSGRQITSGTGVLNLGMGCGLSRVELDADENAVGGVDNINIQKLDSQLYAFRDHTATDIRIINGADFHFAPYSSYRLISPYNELPPIIKTSKFQGNAIPLIAGQSYKFQLILIVDGKPITDPEKYADGSHYLTWTIPGDCIVNYGDSKLFDIAYITFRRPPDTNPIEVSAVLAYKDEDGNIFIDPKNQTADKVEVYVASNGDSYQQSFPGLKAEWVEEKNTTNHAHVGHVKVSSLATHTKYFWETNLPGPYTGPSGTTQSAPDDTWQYFDSHTITLDAGDNDTFYAQLKIPENLVPNTIPIRIQVCKANTCGVTLTTAPVDLHNGAKHEAENDLIIPNDGLDFIFGRQYDSKSDAKSILGYKWETNWCQKFTMPDDDHNGIWDMFQNPIPTAGPVGPDPDGGYTFKLYMDSKDQLQRFGSPEIIPALSLSHYSGQNIERYDNPTGQMTGDPVYISPLGNYGKLKITGYDPTNPQKDWWIKLFQPEGRIETYYGFHGTPQNTDGKLRSIEDRQGCSITLNYDTAGDLCEFILSADPDHPIALTYYPPKPETEKAGLLQSISYRGRTVEYNYEFVSGTTAITDGDLTSVKITGGGNTRETRYEYYQQDDQNAYFGNLRPLMHNLIKIYHPQEVSDKPGGPNPYKVITYYNDPNDPDNYGRVFNENLYSAERVPGSCQYFIYDAINCITKHLEGQSSLGVIKETDYYFNSMGLNTQKVRINKSGGTNLESITNYDSEGRVLSHSDERGITGNSQLYIDNDKNFDKTHPENYFANFRTQHAILNNLNDADEVKAKYLAFMRRFDGCVASSSLDCQCAGAGTEPVKTSFKYDPVTGAVREKTVSPLSGDDPARVWTTYFDYMELAVSDNLYNRLALLMRINTDGTPNADDRKLVQALLEEFGISLNQGDLNGDGVPTDYNLLLGNVVKEQSPEVTFNPASLQKIDEGGISKQYHVRKYQYDIDGKHLSWVFDEAGNKTKFEYYPVGNTGGPAGYVQKKTVYADTDTAAVWSYTYDNFGDLLTQTDPRGVVTQYTYNGFGEPTSLIRDASAVTNRLPGETWPSLSGTPAPLQYTSNFTYDENGQLVHTSVEDRGPNQTGVNWIDTDYKYDMMGRLTMVVQPPANITNNNSNPNSVPTSTSMFYDLLGRLALKVYPAGNADYYSFDEFDHLKALTRGTLPLMDDQKGKLCIPAATDFETLNSHLHDRGGAPTTTNYIYDTHGQLVQTTGDGSGDVCYKFDPWGRPVYRRAHIDNAKEKADYWSYDEFGNLKNEISGKYLSQSAPGAIPIDDTGGYIDTAHPYQYTNYVYDELNRPVQVNRMLASIGPLPSGRVVNPIANPGWTYGDKPAGEWLATRMEYDKAGRLTYLVSDDGSYLKYQYNGFDLPTRVENYRYKQGVTPPVYDAGFVENSYDLCGNLVESDRTDKSTDTSDSKQYRNTYFYDALGRLTTAIDNLNQATDYRYNSRDLLTAVADANGPPDPLRLYQRRSLPLINPVPSCNEYGNVRVFYYDPQGRKVMDRQILTVSGKGDGVHMGEPRKAGRLFIAPWPDATKGGGDGLIDTTYEYDPNGMLASLTDDNGNLTAWSYDSQNRPIVEQKGNRVDVPQHNKADLPKGGYGHTAYLERIYDTLGRLQKVMREDGTQLNYAYPDAGGPVSQINATGPSAAVGSDLQTFAYDTLGRMITSLDKRAAGGIAEVTAGSAYDSLGRVAEESQLIGGDPLKTRFISTARCSDQISKLYYSFSDANSSLLDLNSFGGGALNAVKLTADLGHPIAQYEYLGGVRKRTMRNGVNLDMGTGPGLQLDELGRPKQYAHMKSSAVQAGFQYTYAPAGNVAQLQKLDGSRTAPINPQTYTYDSASRLTGFSRDDPQSILAHSLAWDQDGLGNWNSVKKDGEAIGDLRRDDSWNATISRTEPSENLVYDANGNLTADGQHQFVWDAFGRLYQVKDANGTLIATYRYDALGRRVRKYLYAGNIEIDAVWDGWRMIEEHEGPIGGATADAAARWFVYGNGLDEPLMMHVASSNTDYYYHQDALGSVAALTDSDGAVAERYEYDPYGAHVRINPSGTPTPAPNAPTTLGNPFLYAGRQFDAESGLYYNRHRYYSPDLGRFISTDPISYLGGINLYEYCGNQPVNFTDPLGFDGWENSNPVLGMGAYRTINRNKERFDADLVLKANSLVEKENQQFADAYGYFNKNQNMSNAAVTGALIAGNAAETVMYGIPVWSPVLTVAKPADDVVSGNTQDLKQDLAPVVLFGGLFAARIISGLAQEGATVSAETSNLCKAGDAGAIENQAIMDTSRLLPELAAAAKNPFHHIFPQRPDLAQKFVEAGVDIDKFTLQIPKDLHIEIHSGGPRGGKWNQAWADFFEAKPDAKPIDIYKKAGELIHDFQIPGGPIGPYPKR